MSLNELVCMSNNYGKNPEFVLAGGGNTSVKEKNIIYVKASGESLGTIAESGFVAMELDKLLPMMSKGYTDEADVLKAMMDSRVQGDEKRPSVEALLHAIFPQKFVLHLHPAIVNGLSCSTNGEVLNEKIFGGKVVWMNEVRPGYTLALTAKKAMDEFKAKNGRDCDLLMMQNHGIFFASENVKDIDALVDFVLGKLKENISEYPNLAQADVDQERVKTIAECIKKLGNGELDIVKAGCPESILPFLVNEKAFQPISSSYTPDHIVYYGNAPLFVEYAENIDTQMGLIKGGLEKFNEKYKKNPRIICVSKLGYFACGNLQKTVDTAEILFIDALKIAVYTKSFGGNKFMSDEMIDFICNWEVESYRAKRALA